MNEETEKRLWPKYEKMLGYFRAMSGADSHEEAIKELQVECRDKSTSPAPWLHMRAREIYPTDEPDSVQPELFSEILTEIDSQEKARAIFAKLPEEKAPQIEAFLDFVLKQLLPQLKVNAKLMGRGLPQRHDGGPTTKMPSEEKCRAIYDDVEELAKRVKRGIAQSRVAKRTGLSLRMVQRICKAQKERLSDSQYDDASDSPQE